jgi:hypothetical protein
MPSSNPYVSITSQIYHACTRSETKCLMHAHARKRNASCMYTLGKEMPHVCTRLETECLMKHPMRVNIRRSNE